MPNPVIVGVDGYPGGRDAIALARALAPDAELVLACAYPYNASVSRLTMPEFKEALQELAGQAVEEVRRKADAAEERVELIADPSPAHALQKLAGTRDAALIVLGSSRHGRVSRACLGDVARAVLHGAPCPVAVAPQGYEPRRVRRVGVALDATPEAHEALDVAVTMAGEQALSLSVCTVVPDPVDVPVSPGYVVDTVALRDALQVEAQRHQAQALAALDPRLDVTAAIVCGDVREELATFAEDVDVLVCGSRRWGPLRRVVLGSTSDWLIHHAPCPVLVVPRGA
jgi:nucleotide-binding universal stress UspA family protein